MKFVMSKFASKGDMERARTAYAKQLVAEHGPDQALAVADRSALEAVMHEASKVRALEAAGFVKTYYPTQADRRAFWTRSMKAAGVPYVMKNLAGGEGGIDGNSEVVIEVTPDDGVQMTVGTAYHEEPVPTSSAKGQLLLREAGVRLTWDLHLAGQK